LIIGAEAVQKSGKNEEGEGAATTEHHSQAVGKEQEEQCHNIEPQEEPPVTEEEVPTFNKPEEAMTGSSHEYDGDTFVTHVETDDDLVTATDI
jgi:hypothetical protein